MERRRVAWIDVMFGLNVTVTADFDTDNQKVFVNGGTLRKMAVGTLEAGVLADKDAINLAVALLRLPRSRSGLFDVTEVAGGWSDCLIKGG